ncbi:MAG: CNNM domain-containing protein [Planctomycetota bacterium]|jgi:CBS domain containing-hemolysin-like protein
MVNSIVLILAVVLFVVLGGLFSGAETGLYQLSQLRLRLGIEKKRLSFVVLGKVMRDSPGLLLSMLIGTNLANYLATSIVTLILLSKMEVEHTAELFATLLTAPTLFVFSELVPKNIFFYRADSLMPTFAPVLFAFHKLFTWSGVVPLLKFISRVFARLGGAPVSAEKMIPDVRPSHIKAILRETREEGFISAVQADIIDRVVSIPNITIRSVMTPINKVEMVEQNSDNSALLSKLKKSAFTRLPVYENRPANIVGFINIYEVLGLGQEFTGLHNFVKPIRQLASDTVVSDAMSIMRKENQKIVLVTRAGHAGREKPVGIVTMKDLVEELLGELTEW